MSESTDFVAWMSRASAAMASNRDGEALAYLDRALALRPGDIHVLNAKGSLLGKLGRFDEAVATFQKAIVERPADADLHYNVAFSLQCQGRFADALMAYDRVLRLRPAHPAALNNRGLVLDALGRSQEAVTCFQQALQLDPADPFALSNLGRSLLHLGRVDEAIPQFQAALALRPDYPNAIAGLAVAYRSLERTDELVAVCRKLTEIAPEAHEAWVELGAALATLNRRSEAEECFRRAIELNPESAATHGMIGKAQIEIGELDKAAASFSRACELDPRSPDFLHSLVAIKKVARGDSVLAKLEELRSVSANLDVYENVFVHFALGKALSDIGDNDRSFQHFLEGNRLQRSRLNYDESKVLGDLAATVELFTPTIVKRCSRGGDESLAPIFIVGMPRTGSTLIEQVLAAHRQVLALGELRAFDEAIRALDIKKRSPFPNWLPSLAPDDVSDIARVYRSRLLQIARAHQVSRDATGEQRLVDKMPGNFQFAGLIHLAFPRARIIHTRRDPIDTCLSCFSILFEAMPYTYDLGELGRYFRQYQRLMEKWDASLPKGAILHVDYETLVRDFENVVREIVAYCGLEWDNACLSFHTVERRVRTMSAVQIRQPLFSTSIGRWRPPDDILQPLLNELAATS